MAKSKRKKPDVPFCEECGEQRSLQKELFRIVDRAGFRKKVFCSLSCIDDHLAREMHGWIAVSESLRTNESRKKLVLHRVRIERTDKARLHRE